MSKINISVIGLGKLGSPMVAAFASRGFNVIGLDKNVAYVNAINNAIAPVSETGLDRMIKDNKERIRGTADFNEAILNSDITFIIVPTPSDKNGGFSTEFAVEASREIGAALKNKTGYHLVVLTSTVLPGAVQRDLLPVLEQYSGKKAGFDFGLCYNPEFIALGSVIKDLLNPDFILVGELDEKSGSILEKFYQDFCLNNPPVRRMNIINAELTKISINTFITNKISFINLLTQLCEKLPGGDIDAVAKAVGSDRRIGPHYLRGGLGYGGPCFPRDNRAINYLASTLGVSHLLAESTDKVNKQHTSFLANKIISLIPKGGKVGILGLSYKPDTSVVEESQGIELAKTLQSRGFKVHVYDPASMSAARSVLSEDIKCAESVSECIRDCDAVCLVTPWGEFRNLNPEIFKRDDGRKTILIDCWRVLDRKIFCEDVDYRGLGVNCDLNNQ